MTSWGTESGLLDHCVGTVDRAWFSVNLESTFPDPKPRLHLELVNIENDEGVDLDTFEIRLGTGKDWEIVDDGQAVEDRSGRRNRKFHKMTGLGRVIDLVVKNADGHFDGCLEDLIERGDPTQAHVWVGMRFEWERQEFPLDNGDSYDLMLPVRYLGVEDGAGDGKKGKKGKEAGGSSGKGASGSDLDAALRDLATNSPSYEEFVSQAMRMDGVTDSPELMAKIANEGADGYWASTR